MKLSAIQIGTRSRRALTGIESLAASIEKVGLLHPPAVREAADGSFVLVAGHRRIEAMKLLGWTETRVTVIGTLDDELDALLAEGDENVEREPFTPAEAVAHAARIREVEAARAKERQREAGPASVAKRDGHGYANLAEPSEKPHERTTRARVAKATGYGHTTLAKAERVLAVASDPETPEPVRIVAKEAAERLAQPGAKVDAEAKRLDAVIRAEGGSELAALEFRRNLARAISRAHSLIAFPPERIAEVADEGAIESIDLLVECFTKWRSDITQRRGTGLRLVKGARQ